MGELQSGKIDMRSITEMFSLEGKTAIVTGSGGGIGKGIASDFITGVALPVDGGYSVMP